jgi:hypothetical protein
VCEHCGNSDGNASMMCGGISTHRHSFPANDSVTISRDCAEFYCHEAIKSSARCVYPSGQAKWDARIKELKQALQTEES